MGPGAGSPHITAFGSSAGSAFAARISLPGPLSGPYQANLASIAKANASRHRHKASALRRNVREAGTPDIRAVYHAGCRLYGKKGMGAVIRYRTAESFSAPVIPSMRRYSWVRIERKRGATAGSQGISSERQRSMATRKSRRNATQAGHASICSRIWSQVRGSTRPSRYSERFENRSRHSAGRFPPCSFSPRLRCFRAYLFWGAASSTRLISLRT